MFKTTDLNKTIWASLSFINFLDVQFNLNTGIYQPYSNPSYINKKPNHISVVLNQLQKSISKCISDISSNEKICSNSVPTYSEPSSKNDFDDNLIYAPKTTDYDTSENKKYKRKGTWLNLPFPLNVKTKLRKTFLKLVKKNFPKVSRTKETIFIPKSLNLVVI